MRDNFVEAIHNNVWADFWIPWFSKFLWTLCKMFHKFFNKVKKLNNLIKGNLIWLIV